MRWLQQLSKFLRRNALPAAALVLSGAVGSPAMAAAAPSPMVNQNHKAVWVFAFKFNIRHIPNHRVRVQTCLFGGSPQPYASSQRYVLAQAVSSALRDGPGLIGTSTADPVGATFAKFSASGLNFVVWNDQFYRHPPITGCAESCGGPWGHSKGVVGGTVRAAASSCKSPPRLGPVRGTAAAPRAEDGNTLGCVDDNDVKSSQHFFAVRLNPNDVAAVLDALANASVVTNVSNPQLARIGGPPELQQRALMLGKKSASTTLLDVMLSSGVRLISKPSRLHVPPWQMLSARLGGIPLRTATWWASPRIPTTTAGQTIICWRSDLGSPGAVDIALTGHSAGRRSASRADRSLTPIMRRSASRSKVFTTMRSSAI